MGRKAATIDDTNRTREVDERGRTLGVIKRTSRFAQFLIGKCTVNGSAICTLPNPPARSLCKRDDTQIYQVPKVTTRWCIYPPHGFQPSVAPVLSSCKPLHGIIHGSNMTECLLTNVRPMSLFKKASWNHYSMMSH